MVKNRKIDFDVLRSIVILSAFILHYNGNIQIGLLSSPSHFVQTRIFSVGGFFFFTAGYMAYKIYLPKFIENPNGVSWKLLKKGVMIIVIYLSYVLFMHIFTGTIIPENATSFILKHRFYTKVLFTFSILFIITPLILKAVSTHPRITFYLFLLTTGIVIFYNGQWEIPIKYKRIFLDRKLFLYPILPSLVVYFFGFGAALFERKWKLNFSSRKLIIISISILVVHSALCKFSYTYFKIIGNKQHFVIIESITPFLAIIIINYLLEHDAIRRFLSSEKILCIGVYSLHFYVISNLILGLLQIPNDSSQIFKLLGLFGTGTLAYIFTYWRFGNSLLSSSNQQTFSKSMH